MVRAVIATLIMCVWVIPHAAARQLPAGFFEFAVPGPWNQAIGLTYASTDAPTYGRLYVWERGGRVWTVENGVKASSPFLDISEEVGNWRDFGLVGFALDPHFTTNGYVYLAYVVDYHHLKHFGTAEYSPTANEYLKDTIARVTRYTARSTDGFRSVDPASRLVLVGESITTGVPICHQSHGIGALTFGEDGTLLVACGDGASFETTDTGGPINGSSNTALADGIIKPKEDVGAFRAQLVDSLSGKILRIDPETGDGVPSNPFYDNANPRAPRSRVWALGMRNPYRFSVIPGTGSPNPADATPGTLLVGDVQWSAFEEIDVVDGPGKNLGWPLFEGLTPMANYQAAATLNLDAPNPLACGGHLMFRSLCVQESLSPSWPNPCDANEQIDASTPRFMHTRPVLDWSHAAASARAPAFSGNSATTSEVGNVDGPTGESFQGNCVTAGVWYDTGLYPPAYDGSYFFADYGRKWIRNLTFNPDGSVREVRPFLPDGSAAIVCLVRHPSGDLVYASFDGAGVSTLRRITFAGAGNLPPTAAASATPMFGASPLTVQFSSAGSLDPENLPLTYEWDFGDGGSKSTLPNPVHTYSDELDVTSLGTVIARVYDLSPPGPQGSGNHDKEIIRDGDRPPSGSNDLLRQFDTFHSGDQGNSDWVGYSFPQDIEFTSLLFQDGVHAPTGGYFNTITVQYSTDPHLLNWQIAQNVVFSPVYAGQNLPNFQTYRISFTPVTARGIRIRGIPGGADKYISVAELRVYTRGQVGTDPRCYPVTLRVTDITGASATADLNVAANNTPPQVQITSPVDGTQYVNFRPTLVPLAAVVSDDSGQGGLSCSWQVLLHHNNHVHPEPIDLNCTSTAVVSPHDGDCNDMYYEFRLTVSDGCLSTTRSVNMFPNCCAADFNNDGFGDALDYDAFVNVFITADPAADYNGDEFVDAIDYDLFITAFLNGC